MSAAQRERAAIESPDGSATPFLRSQLSSLPDHEHLRRARVFDSDRFKHNFITVFGDLRAELGLRIVGYVLMPDSNADITNRCVRRPRKNAMVNPTIDRGCRLPRTSRSLV
jgi:hypothetical protein